MKNDWKRLIAEYDASGLSQSEFAKKRGISLGSLTYQRRKAKNRSSFVQVVSEERIELELAGGIVLRVSERSLTSVLRALQS